MKMKKSNNNNWTKPQVMGILNLTPDSFYDGDSYKDNNQALLQVEKMLKEGASSIDIGGYSSRPKAKHISEKEELERILPTIKSIIKTFPKIQVSVDTFRSEVARQTVLEGATMINDISGGTMDKKMFTTIAAIKVPYVLMHMQGTPQTMQDNPNYTNVTDTVYQFFKNKTEELYNLGVQDVILDVGFGFGKTLAQNYELLQNLSKFKKLGFPLLVGVSRKSMLYKLLNSTPDKMLNATTIAHTIALQNGASILRAHDVKEAVEVVEILEMMRKIDKTVLLKEKKT